MNETHHRIYFRLELIVPLAYVGKPADAQITFAVPDLLHRNLVINLQNLEGGARGSFREDVVCHVMANYDVAESTVEFVRSFLNGKLVEVAPGEVLPHRRAGRLIVEADGVIVKNEEPHVEVLPLAIQDLINTAQSEMYGAASRFLHLLRWQQGASFTEEIIRYNFLRWNVGGSAFHAVPCVEMPAVALGIRKGLCWDKSASNALSTLWAMADQNESEAHKLYWLAESLRSKSHRAAVLILAAALETAVKRHIEKVDPDATWKANMGEKSPALMRLLDKTLPDTYQKLRLVMPGYGALRPWIDDIRRLSDYRSTIAHDKASFQLPYGFDHYFQRALDLIYYLDVVEGHEWAKQRLSPDMCRAQGWSPPPPGLGAFSYKLT